VNIMFGNNRIEISTLRLGEAFATITSLRKSCKIYIDLFGTVRTVGELVPNPKALFRVLQEYDKIAK